VLLATDERGGSRGSFFNSLLAGDSGIGTVRKVSECGCRGSRRQSERPLIYDTAVDYIEWPKVKC
jgi:hypothetical protein